jgi:hypothetical protein
VLGNFAQYGRSFHRYCNRDILWVMRQQFAEPLNPLTYFVEHFPSLSSTHVPPFANVQMLVALPHHAFFVDCVWNIIAHAQKPDFASRAKRTSPFKSGGGSQFSRLLAAEVCASAAVMLDTPCSEVVWKVLATHSIRQFPLHFPRPVRHFVPSHFNWTLLHRRLY